MPLQVTLVSLDADASIREAINTLLEAGGCNFNPKCTSAFDIKLLTAWETHQQLLQQGCPLNLWQMP